MNPHSHEVVVSSILQVKELKFRGVKGLARSHTADKRRAAFEPRQPGSRSCNFNNYTIIENHQTFFFSPLFRAASEAYGGNSENHQIFKITKRCIFKVSFHEGESSPVEQYILDPGLSLQQLGLLPWHRFNPWPRNFHIPQTLAKNK